MTLQSSASRVKPYYKKRRVNGKRKCLHRAIVEEYIGRQLTEDEVVHHIDGNRSNNDISNLMVMTQSKHAKLHHMQGDYANMHSQDAKERNRKAIQAYYSEHINKGSKKVAKCSKDGEVLETFDSAYRVRLAGFDHRHVSACCLGKRKTHKGFIWKFV